MAEAVKNNSRKRRPPSHLYEGYNEDNFEPGNNQFFASNRDQNRQPPDPFTISSMSRLLAKFVNSANKKFSDVRTKKQEQQNAISSKRQNVSESKATAKTDKAQKQERQPITSRVREIEETRENVNRQDITKDRYQQKNYKKIPNTPISSSLPQTKKVKAQTQSAQTAIKNTLPSPDLMNIQSMAKMSRQQLFKMLPRGADPNHFKQQLLQSASSDRNLGRLSSFGRFGGLRDVEFRQDTKLFKRAAFHIGIAYNIHIDNIKQRNPHFTHQELDPTYVSRKLKQESSDAQKRQNEERLRQEALLKQRQQALTANKSKQRQMKNQNELTPNKHIMKSGEKKEPICIDIEDESQENAQMSGARTLQQNQATLGIQPELPNPESDQRNKIGQAIQNQLKVQSMEEQEKEPHKNEEIKEQKREDEGEMKKESEMQEE